MNENYLYYSDVELETIHAPDNQGKGLYRF